MSETAARNEEGVWAFGYGSLMSGGWEADLGCVDRLVATLPGYRRVFNKLSQKNWGSKAAPCPTLNLQADPSGECQGMAFSFPAARKDDVLAYLAKREGKDFLLQLLRIRLRSGADVEAFVPLYTGKNLCGEISLEERAGMIRSARGTDGAGIDYVRNLAAKLDELGIDDLVVRELRDALRSWV